MSDPIHGLRQIDWSGPLLIAGVLLLIVLLSGCATIDGPPSSTTAVCKALIGPIKYNSTNPRSARHAGADLAVDLKARNEVGDGLGCPAYR